MKRSALRSANLSSGKKKKPGDKSFFRFLPLICLVLTIGGIVAYWLWPTPTPCSHDNIPIVVNASPNVPTRVTIYLDNSSSMIGYANGGKTAYIDALSDLLCIYPNTNAAYFDKEDAEKAIIGKDLISTIRMNRLPYKGESLLHKDLERITTIVSKNKNSLCFFVTDGIMSFSNKEIAKDREKNFAEAKSLMNLVSDAFKKKEVMVSIYQLKSSFTGVYYCYNNDTVNLNGDERYFYVIAIGSSECLTDLKDRIEKKYADKLFKFRPTGEWHCIEKNTINSNVTLEPTGAFKKNCDSENCNIYYYDIKHVNNSGAVLQINIPSSNFTNYEHHIDSIAKHCQVSLDNRKLNGVVASDKSGLHITLNTKEQLAKQSKIDIQIEYFYPFWVAKRSKEKDLYMKTQPDPNTFQLEYFTRGIFNGIFNDEHHPIFSKTIHLIQK